MQFFLDRILTLNLIGSTAVFYIAARIYLLPRLPTFRPRAVLIPILLLHALRHLGLMFLTRGAIYPGLAPQFAWPAAIGDFTTAILALVALGALARDPVPAIARPLVWIFNVFGTLDLIDATVLANVYGTFAFMGPAYWIPAFWVPALLVTHYITYLVLLRHWTGASSAA
jgi:hypothetical protein